MVASLVQVRFCSSSSTPGRSPRDRADRACVVADSFNGVALSSSSRFWSRCSLARRSAVVSRSASASDGLLN